jgi:hypothetical protein
MSEITKTSSHWVKQLYYYAILGFSILFLAIGFYTVIRASLVKFVFTNIQDNYGVQSFQNEILNGGLLIIISGIVLILHTRFVKIRD